MTTPYFAPDDPSLLAICSAAHRGVEVDLVVSLHANQRFTQLAQQSYYDTLLDSGVRIHLYRPHFLHAKHISIDDCVAMVGSTNMDIRSFALNAEINILFYDCAIVSELRRIQEKYFANSDLLSAAEWSRRPVAAQGDAKHCPPRRLAVVKQACYSRHALVINQSLCRRRSPPSSG